MKLSTYLVAALLAGLLVLAIGRPWQQVNQTIGFAIPADSLRADTLSHAELDSLIINTDQVAITLPDAVSDSLSYSVAARKKKKAYLEEQSQILQKQNQQLDLQLQKKRKELEVKQQSLLSMEQIEQALAKQSGKPQTASNLVVSELEIELNKRSQGVRNNRP
ncbi:hypothetical protein GCM10028819_32060 [Spirosoma humi]